MLSSSSSSSLLHFLNIECEVNISSLKGEKKYKLIKGFRIRGVLDKNIYGKIGGVAYIYEFFPTLSYKNFSLDKEEYMEKITLNSFKIIYSNCMNEL